MAAPITISPGIEVAPSFTCLTESLHQVCDGRELSAGMAHELLRCDDNVLHELLAAARSIKERFHPAVITYSRKVFLPLTNLCRDYCGYCTFRRDPGEPGAHTMTPDEVLDGRASRARSWDAPRRCSRWATSRRCFSRRCARRCAAWVIAARCIIWKPCASWCCARPVCCRTPIPDC